MYDNIRDLIRENEIAEALNAMEELPLPSELKGRLLTIHRRWRIYEDKAMGNLEEDRLLRIEENQIVEDIITLLNRAEESGQTVRQREVKVTYTERSEGAAAGAKERTTSKGLPLSYLLGALGLIALLALGWWATRPDPDPGVAATEATEEKPTPPPAEEKPAGEKPPASTNPPPRQPGGDLTIRDPSPAKVDGKLLQVDPKILQNTRILDALKTSTAMMTEGPLVPMATAVYYNSSAPTEFNAELTRSLSSYLTKKIGREVSTEVLTNAFHTSTMRDRMVLRGTGGDERIKASRAKYLMLCDVRQVVGEKGYLRMSLYDVSRQKGFTRGKSITIRSGSGFSEKEMLYAVADYLSELRERGLFK